MSVFVLSEALERGGRGAHGVAKPDSASRQANRPAA